MSYEVSEQRFHRVSLAEFLAALLIFACQAFFVWYFHALGFWIGIVLGNLLVTALLAYWYFLEHPGIQSVRFDVKIFKSVLPQGIAVLISSVAYTPFITLAKLYLGATLGADSVGYFFIAIMIMTKLAIVSRIVARVYLPTLSLSHASDKSLEEIRGLFVKSQIYTSFLTLVAALLAAGLLKPFLDHVMPQYLPGLNAAFIMILAALPLSMVDNASQLLIVFSHKRKYVADLILILCAQLFLLMFLSWYGITLERVALSFVVTFVFYALLINVQALKILSVQKGRA